FAIEDLTNDPAVKTIVLFTNSPGGSVDGVPELAAKVRAAAAQKRVVATVTGMMASAAYWVGSQATELVASPSSRIGSIGVIAMHLDFPGALEKEGIVPTVMTSSKFKAEGNMFSPLPQEARDWTQSQINMIHADFVSAVAAGRGKATAT